MASRRFFGRQSPVLPLIGSQGRSATHLDSAQSIHSDEARRDGRDTSSNFLSLVPADVTRRHPSNPVSAVEQPPTPGFVASWSFEASTSSSTSTDEDSRVPPPELPTVRVPRTNIQQMIRESNIQDDVPAQSFFPPGPTQEVVVQAMRGYRTEGEPGNSTTIFVLCWLDSKCALVVSILRTCMVNRDYMQRVVALTCLAISVIRAVASLYLLLRCRCNAAALHNNWIKRAFLVLIALLFLWFLMISVLKNDPGLDKEQSVTDAGAYWLTFLIGPLLLLECSYASWLGMLLGNDPAPPQFRKIALVHTRYGALQQSLSSNTDSANGSTCAICLEDFESEDNVTHLPCEHFFHSGCVQNWLHRGGGCPFRCQVHSPTHEQPLQRNVATHSGGRDVAEESEGTSFQDVAPSQPAN